MTQLTQGQLDSKPDVSRVEYVRLSLRLQRSARPKFTFLVRPLASSVNGFNSSSLPSSELDSLSLSSSLELLLGLELPLGKLSSSELSSCDDMPVCTCVNVSAQVLPTLYLKSC